MSNEGKTYQQATNKGPTCQNILTTFVNYYKNWSAIKLFPTYRSFAALIIAFFLVNAFVIKQAHHLLHDHHSGTEHTEHCGTDTHFHTFEYEFVDCPICQFNFSPKDHVKVDLPDLKAPECSIVFTPYQIQPYVRFACTLPSLRAPPAILI